MHFKFNCSKSVKTLISMYNAFYQMISVYDQFDKDMWYLYHDNNISAYYVYSFSVLHILYVMSRKVFLLFNLLTCLIHFKKKNQQIQKVLEMFA